MTPARRRQPMDASPQHDQFVERFVRARDRLDLHDLLDARRHALAECLDRLKHESRDLLERCYAGKDSIKVIAADLGRPPNVVYMTLKRLRRALFDCINLNLTTQGVT